MGHTKEAKERGRDGEIEEIVWEGEDCSDRRDRRGRSMGYRLLVHMYLID